MGEPSTGYWGHESNLTQPVEAWGRVLGEESPLSQVLRSLSNGWS